MKNGKKIFLFMVAAAAVSLLIAACSCDRDKSLSKVRQAGHIRLATSAGYSPFSFYNDKKELVGFDIDVAGEVAKRLGVDLEIIDTPWEGIIDGLNARRYDGILGSMSVTEARRAVVSFSTPYYYSRTRVMVQSDSPFKGHAELKDKTIGIAAGTTFERDAGSIGSKNIRRYASDDEALIGLHKGEVDAVITDEIVGVYMVNRKKLRIKSLGVPLGEEQIAVAFRKEDKALLAKVNHALQAMQKDGAMRRLMEKTVREGY
ncbi:MAG: transporter substrate-binding domain-containing protein [Syntrophales bacterium]|nr:transporter substrate-binding domain-containing protein [Syntrophales bacterium]